MTESNTYHFIWTSHASSSFYALAFACASYATETIKTQHKSKRGLAEHNMLMKQLART